MTSESTGTPRPDGVSASAVALALMALAFFGVARSTGAGWVIVLICGLLAALVVGAVWPAVALLRPTLAADGPRDGTVGEPLPLTLALEAGGLFQLRPVDSAGDWIGAVGGARGEVLVIPPRRGVQTTVDVVLRSGGPLGLFRWRRTFRVILAQPIHIGPAPTAASLGEVLPPAAEGADATPRHRLGHDGVRSVREYVAGDPFRMVHWPSTARTGELMVREMEAPDAPHLVLSVDLGGGGNVAEAIASRAAGLGRAALRSGLPLTLLTAESDGPRAGRVATALDLGRRLAKATTGTPASGPLPAGAVVVAVVTP